MPVPRTIRLEDVRTHNLDHVTVEVPHGALTVVTGVSGSGKSSLAFDTLHAVGERRYLETLSSHGRRFLQRVPEPEVGRVERVSPSIALSQRIGSSDPRSTVGTLSGVHDMLRVAYAEATGREPRDFSFVTAGACPGCGGSGSQDEVVRDLLIADPEKTLRGGALVPTTKSGYIVYSQVTIDVLDDVCRAHGFDVDTPWRDLTREQQDVVFFGSDRIEVPFGKHTLESRMRWEGIKAKPRELGHYKGLIPTIAETLKRNRNENALRFARSVPCPACSGSRLDERARTATLDGVALGDALTGELAELAGWAERRGGALARRVDALLRLGLGHLALARATASLSAGEFQRIRLSALATTGMSGVTFVFDEPSVGLHATEERAVLDLLVALRDEGNTVVVVEHSELAIAVADHVIQLGPGAGVHGGRVVAVGPPEVVCPPRREAPMRARIDVDDDGEALTIEGASARNLQGIDIRVPHGRLTVIAGVAGAGKSTLLHDVLADGVRRRVEGGVVDATSVHAIRGFERLHQVVEVDQSPIGRSPRSNPATYTGLFDVVRKLFAEEPDAKARGFDASTFSFNSKAGGRCPDCEGSGREVVGMLGLPDVELVCATCAGRRFRDDVLEVRCRRLPGDPTILDVLDASVETALAWVRAALEGDGDKKLTKVEAILDALDRVGLGYLTLGQRATSLSGGEAQRVRLAGEIAKTARSRRALFVLDEPTVGLHREDVARLVTALDALVRAGHTVVVVEHDLDVLEAADRVIELGPGSGSRGGRICAIGTVDELREADTPTGRALRERARGAGERRAQGRSEASLRSRPTVLKGVATNNLGGFDVEFPAGAWTVVTGISGSGKSSLVFDTLHGASRARFVEHLSRHARQQLGSTMSPWLVSATHGLRPTIALEQRIGGATAADRRGIVATSSGLHPLLRTLWSRVGVGPDGRRVAASELSFFRREGACPACSGAGVTLRCVPDRLIADPSKPLFGGALDRSHKSIRYYADENGRYHAIVRAVGSLHGVDFDRPWSELSDSQRLLAMRGCGDEEIDVVWDHAVASEGGAQPHRWRQTFDGLAGEIDREYARKLADGRGHELEALLGPDLCESCGGDRLAVAGRSVAIAGVTLPALCRQTIGEVLVGLPHLVPGDDPRREVADVVLPEVVGGLERLAGLGLAHLALDRSTDSLSVGERQRLRLARQLAAPLFGVTYVLDEPSTGLHPKDTEVLIQALRDLVRSGNQVVTVEHDPDLVAAADHVIEIGPGAGADGGRLVASGTPAELRADGGASRTGRVLRERGRLEGEKGVATARAPRARGPGRRSQSLGGRADGREGPRQSNGALSVRGAALRYLADLDVTFPLGCVTAVTGVSGSGKSTLVLDVLAASLAAGRPVGCAAIEGIEEIERTVVDAGARASRSRRQCAASLLGVFDPIRKEFADTEMARGKRWRATHFGWDGKKTGACVDCGGLGRIATGLGELDLLGGSVTVPCERCKGRRFDEETLAVRAFHDLSIADVLESTIDGFLGHLESIEAPSAKLVAPLRMASRVGLGYLRLGQGADTLSGGEAQRLELATHLDAAERGRRSGTIFVLDEPTRGLHPDDVARLQELIDSLADRGNTVVVIEHDLAVIAAADHVIDLGPGAGVEGGRVLFAGTPGELARAETATGRALARARASAEQD
jgi:excinuclease ABC subunit A